MPESRAPAGRPSGLAENPLMVSLSNHRLGMIGPLMVSLFGRAPSGLAVALALLLIAGALVVVGAAVDVAGRPSGPETVARRYFAALEASDVAGALDAIEPSARARWVPFVENGLGNEYRVLGVAVRQPSILDRLRGSSGDPQDVTVFLDVIPAVEGGRWEATPRVPLVRLDGRWYLAHPPLAPM